MIEDYLEVLACPLCKRPLIYDPQKKALICRFDHLAYLIEEGVPLLLPEKAQKIYNEDFVRNNLDI